MVQHACHKLLNQSIRTRIKDNHLILKLFQSAKKARTCNRTTHIPISLPSPTGISLTLRWRLPAGGQRRGLGNVARRLRSVGILAARNGLHTRESYSVGAAGRDRCHIGFLGPASAQFSNNRNVIPGCTHSGGDRLEIVDHWTSASCIERPILCAIAFAVVTRALAPTGLARTRRSGRGAMDGNVERFVAQPPFGSHGDGASRHESRPDAGSFVSSIRELTRRSLAGCRELAGADEDVDVFEDPIIGHIGCHCHGPFADTNACFARRIEFRSVHDGAAVAGRVDEDISGREEL
jgi:hypothetical protein